MTDDTEQTEAAPSMDDLIRSRNTRTERQRANHVRLFGPRGDTADDTVTDDDGDDAA